MTGFVKNSKRIFVTVAGLVLLLTAVYSFTAYGQEIEGAFDIYSGKQIIPLSKKGMNVIVIMLDRAINGYVPFMFEDEPLLAEEFSGFTHYPNTVGYGCHTNYALPALYGGYEYTPWAMNERDSELLVDKHNEALKVLPVLFGNRGFKVTVCDPPFANYQQIPDLSIYNGYENINAYNVQYAYQPYDDPLEYYNMVNIDTWFNQRKEVLDSLPSLTNISDSQENTFLFLQNDITHWPTYVEESAGYNLTTRSLNGVLMYMDDYQQQTHYMTNIAAFKSLGQWFAYLKEQGVYDNTRIIITSDHGFSLYQFDHLWMSGGRDVQFINPLLMVKDFYATGPLKLDHSFMTNADVPTLATRRVIQNPVNPFTQNALNNYTKNREEQLTTSAHQFYIEFNNGTAFDTSDGSWWGVHDDIGVEENWTCY